MYKIYSDNSVAQKRHNLNKFLMKPINNTTKNKPNFVLFLSFKTDSSCQIPFEKEIFQVFFKKSG